MTQQPPPEQSPPYPGSGVPPFPGGGGRPAENSAFERSGALMPAVVAVAVAWTVIEWLMVIAAPSAVQTYQQAVFSRTSASGIVTGYDLLALLFGVASLVAFVLTVIWLARARRNADRIAPDEQRRSKFWVWLGWLFPIVSFWFPKQVIDDVWRSTVQNARQPNTGWWWGSWIAAQLLSTVAGRAFTIDGEPREEVLEYLVLLEAFTALAMTIAVVGWIRVVRTISEAQDALAGGAPPPVRARPLPQ